MRILLLGHGEHGKDAAAEILTRLTGMTSAASSKFACDKFIYDKLKIRFGYGSPEECYADRRHHRELWKQLICDYVEDDKTRLARELTDKHPIYVGMRDIQEFDATEDLFDHIVYIDASERITKQDPTMEIPRDRATVIIDNNGTLQDLEDLLYLFCNHFGLLKEE